MLLTSLLETNEYLICLSNHISLHYVNLWLWIMFIQRFGVFRPADHEYVKHNDWSWAFVDIYKHLFNPLWPFSVCLFIMFTWIFSFHSTGKNPYKKPDGVKVGSCELLKLIHTRHTWCLAARTCTCYVSMFKEWACACGSWLQKACIYALLNVSRASG